MPKAMADEIKIAKIKLLLNNTSCSPLSLAIKLLIRGNITVPKAVTIIVGIDIIFIADSYNPTSAGVVTKPNIILFMIV